MNSVVALVLSSAVVSSLDVGDAVKELLKDVAHDVVHDVQNSPLVRELEMVLADQMCQLPAMEKPYHEVCGMFFIHGHFQSGHLWMFVRPRM
jgi:hypothetical protein